MSANMPGPPRPRAARPRDAATLILFDRSGPAPRFLLGRRSEGHSFLPGKWVFPGGALERRDFGVTAASDLAGEIVAALGPSLPPRRARALAVAAVRETWEETGLALGTSAAPRAATLPFVPHLRPLGFIARFVTPPHLPRRFDTRFFTADAAELNSLTPSDSRELTDLAWFTLDECRPLALLAPTRLAIDALAARLSGYDGPTLYRRFKAMS